MSNGWMTGFEPATPRITTYSSSDVSAGIDKGLQNAHRATGPNMAPKEQTAPSQVNRIDPELAAVVDAWSSLPEPVRAGIVAMILTLRG